MKLKPTVLLATFVVTMGLLLGASAALAEPIVILDGNSATHIQNLDVGGTLYNVTFLRTSADNLYGDPPVFDFSDDVSAREAKNAVNLALNTDNRATRVGPSADQGIRDYGIGYTEQVEPSGATLTQVHNGSYIEREIHAWVDADIDFWPPAEEDRIYADFSFAGPTPDPVTIGGSVSGLTGSGLVLQNKGRDDLPIGQPTVPLPLRRL